MPPKSLVGNRSSGHVASHHNGSGGVALAISARHELLSDSWASDVEKLELAIRRFNADWSMANNCEVVLFEIAGDEQLHVNVTHKYATKSVRGGQDQAVCPMALFTIEDSVIRHRTT